ncbi:hypothetical protein [Oricola sp.]|uniref:hypothetical protein n=1 Tax=Oricola sp. TaxID=1979950 RepID=UPI0025E5BBC6|nr:hypothetical protein [Oricola sp.]MCI5078705.1 hypothetical protein [Oricola sp.]
MRSAVNTITTKLEITQVRDVQVTDAVDDGEGGYIRAIRFLGEPSAAAGAALILEVQIRSSTEADLDIITPALSF